MIWGEWNDPNFEFSATDSQGVKYEFFCHAADATELEQRLKAKKLTVSSIRPYDFAKWKKSAREATDKVVWQRIRNRWSFFATQVSANWPWLTNADLATIAGNKRLLSEAVQQHDGCTKDEATLQIDQWSSQLIEDTAPNGQKTAFSFNQAIWKQLKWHLFDLFHGKCAYCENKPLAAYAGDVEHYRPKAKVDEDTGHPGYYWLAYSEKNLLPSCALCNQFHAKMTHFPVQGAHAHDARGIAAERPLLLNPYDKSVDPFQHLSFNEAGESMALNQSPNGEYSRKLYHLDRPGLSEDRFDMMQTVEQDWRSHLSLVVSIPMAYNALRANFLRGDCEYSAARLWALDRLRKRTIEELTILSGVGPGAP